MLSRSRLAIRLSRRLAGHRQPLLYRHISRKSPSQWNSGLMNGHDFSQPAMYTLDYFQRFLKFSLVGLLAVGVTVSTAFEATHMWVEKVELAPETDEEVRKWEWDIQTDDWFCRSTGGTDPALGFKGRHAVRSAWIALNWGTGSSTNLIGPKATGGGGLNIVESRLAFAQNFLDIAIEIATSRQQAGAAINPETLNSLIARRASLMGLMGTKDALVEARSEFKRLWDNTPRTGVGAARMALKLGDLNARLGDANDALVWWTRAIQLACGNDPSSRLPPMVPQEAPSSPLAQRTLISTLVSLSTYYATTGQLRQAQTVEESTLSLLKTIRQPQSLSSVSPPHALHGLYVVHRAALLSIHLAEVLHTLRNPPETTIRWLTSAAESSERVARSLTGLPPIHPDAPNSKIPHPPSSEAPLIDAYSKSKSMRKPASSLLRGARRSAAEAWHLIGLLNEGSNPDSAEKALECYERALGWVGVAADKVGGIPKPGEGTLEAEWEILWNNYCRARTKTIKSKISS